MRSRVLVAVAMVVALGSCSGDDPPESADGPGGGGGQQTLPPSSPTTEPPAVTSTTLDEREAAEEALDAELRAAYERYWDTFDALFPAPNPDDPRLLDVATGLTLTVLRDSLASDQAAGITSDYPSPSVAEREVMSVEWAGRGEPGSDPGTVTEALVEACHVDDAEVYGPDGAVIYAGVTTARWELTFVRGEDGVWRVTRSDFFDEVEGVTSCVAA